MASRKRKAIGFITEEKSAHVVNEIVNDSVQIQIIFLNFQVVRRVKLKVQMKVTFQYRALAADRLPQLQGFL